MYIDETVHLFAVVERQSGVLVHIVWLRNSPRVCCCKKGGRESVYFFVAQIIWLNTVHFLIVYSNVAFIVQFIA